VEALLHENLLGFFWKDEGDFARERRKGKKTRENDENGASIKQRTILK